MASITLRISNVKISEATAIAEEVCDEFNCMDGDAKMEVIEVEPDNAEEWNEVMTNG